MNPEHVSYNISILEICKNICCNRNDHVVCPITLCSELLHPNARINFSANLCKPFGGSSRVTKCVSIKCIADNHVLCPACGYTLHIEFNQSCTTLVS